jgi:antitoxin (DNA-binding transcriptional repressor) of toxin-antitoxin stability system
MVFNRYFRLELGLLDDLLIEHGQINIHEAKTHLSRYVGLLESGETIILCKRNMPIAEIRGIPRARREKRPIGLAKGKWKAGSKFLEPLPAELLKSFSGT